MSLRDEDWDYPAPYVHHWDIAADEIDHYNHVNNVAYVKMLETVAWAHSNNLGLSIDEYRALDRGMAIRRHEIDYLGAALLGDTLACATWVVTCDGRLSLTRHFQFRRLSDGKTLLRAQTDFVCIALSSGKPKRMPQRYASVYGAAKVQE
ncbi:acyl-CoA thioesterase [Aestuariibacter halophilus]|uniref:Acyl-CoA thioesterase n=1 Tax=Fluctibacter halophilus TaxID=226011 RepID=A0ABS8G878_9ALTE|nr:acyl-CoA thioesterase [Aestuariibacter halophilus]MCC2616750.1 acyl-CoA thioesterase [Aestuariibacter halophilus]